MWQSVLLLSLAVLLGLAVLGGIAVIRIARALL
jgi:hypothetical protein